MAKKSSGRAQAPTMKSNQSVSVSVEKIKNGYLVTKTTSGPRSFKQEREYSKTAPKLPKV